MNKRITAIILAAVIAAGMGGCSKTPNRFKVVERFEGGCVYVDRETGIGYARLYDTGDTFPLYDFDGSLYRPNGWRDYDGSD